MSDGRFGYVPNLHVILDGENRARAGTYLPFGIELVRKLIRQGRYANSKTVAVDDAVITAKVVGEQRWLRIWVGGRCELYLESGIVDVGSIGPANPAFNDSGKLYTNPALAAIPELNGLLKLPLVAESPAKPISGDVAESFKKKIVTDEFGNETVDQSSLSELQRKKLTVATVPPSLFTGKTRLYVQSIYGRRLKHFKPWSMNPEYQPPAIRYSGTQVGESYTVDISTNTGVYTTEDYEYFLITVAYGTAQNVTIRKLEAESACVEGARAYLVKNKSTLTEEKKTALEAYILSGSYPSNAVVFAADATVDVVWQMGYGWHFNWSGTACDIVKVDTISTGGATYKHKSTHYRMEFARDKDKIIPVSDPPLTPVQQERMRWAAIKQTTVEEAEWKNGKWQQVIAFPDWSVNQLEIFGTQLGARFGDEAPIYCFYRRDELQVVRFSLSGGDSVVMHSRTSSPASSYGVLGWVTCTPPPSDVVTRGFEGVSYADYTRNSMPVSASFNVGATSVGGESEAYSGMGGSYSTKTRTYNDSFFSPSYGTVNAPVGPAEEKFVTVGTGACATSKWDWNSSGHATVSLGPGYISNAWYIQAEYSHTTYSRSYATQANLLCVIPFGDAEAAYFWGSQHTVESDTGETKNLRNNLQALVDIVKLDGAEAAESYNYYSVGDVGSPSVLSTAPYSSVSDTTAPLGAYCVSNAGTLVFTPPGLSAFFSGYPTTHVAQTWWTRTSAALASLAGEGIPLTGGYPQDGHVFVGHA